MTPADLANWQHRLGLSQVEAAHLLKMPVQSYRNLLRRRRHAKGLPGPIAELCALLEKRTAVVAAQRHQVATVGADDIRALDERSLVELLNRLLHLEAEAAGLPQSNVHVPAQINLADKGEDGRIEWSGGPERTAVLPARLVQFQVKATDMGPAKCAAEMRDKSGTLKQTIRDVLAAGGAYVIFYNRPLSQAKIEERTAKMRGVLAESKLKQRNLPLFVWDANKIADWTNAHYPAALWVIERVRRDGILPFQTLEKWARDKNISTFHFVSDTRVETVAKPIDTHLVQPKSVVRLVGLSGLGKTRLAFEAIRRAPPSIQSRVLYTHSGFGHEKILQVVQAIREYCKSAIIIVDDCPLELHMQLASVVEHADSRLSLLTIDCDPPRACADQVTLEIDRADNHVVVQIIKQVAPRLSDAEADRLTQFAQGFPQIAVLIAKAWPFEGQNISSLADAWLVEKMVFGRGQHNAELLRTARALSIYDIVGLEGTVANEIRCVANVAHVDPQLIYGHVQTLIDRGLVQNRGRFVQVQPKPIALKLAVSMLQPLPMDHICELVGAGTPERLKKSLFKQLSYLDRVDKIREATAKFCAPNGPFSDPAFLDDNINAECLARLAEINPSSAMGALERAFGAKTAPELRQVTRGRRWLIWTLDRLSFREATFHRAAKLMLDFAVAENEEQIANNATGMFTSLFKVYLSGTETPARKRLSIIDDALSSSDAERRKIAVVALGRGLEIGDSFRIGGAEVQGSSPALKDWAPATSADLADYYRECLSRLVKEATATSNVSRAAKHEIAETLHGLIDIGMVDEVRAAVEQLVAANGSYWPEAVHQISKSLRFERPGIPPEYRKKVQELYHQVSPQSLKERLRLYVSELPWDHYVPGYDESLEPGMKLAQTLAEECSRQWEKFLSLIPQLVAGQQRYTYEFGKRIFEFAANDQDLVDLVECNLDVVPKEEAAPDLLGGILAAAEQRNPSLVDRELDRIVNNPNLVGFLPWLTMQTRIDDSDVARIVLALRGGKITPDSARVLGMGRVLAHLAPAQVAPLIDTMLDAGRIGLRSAVEVLNMYADQRAERYEGLRAQIRRIFTEFEIKALLDGRAIVETHHYGMIAKWLLSRGMGDEDAKAVAAKLAQEIVRWCIARPGNLVDVQLIEGLLRDLLQHQGDTAWPVLAEGMAAHRDKLWAFEHPLGGSYSGEKSAGVIFLMPWQALRAWCHRHPDFAPAFLMRVAPTLESGHSANAEQQMQVRRGTAQVGRYWHPIILGLLDDFGDHKGVLSALSANMMSFSCWGSLVPYFEQYLEPLNALLNHHRPSVVAWARQQLEAQSQEIGRARKQDDESEFGVY